MKLKLTEKQIEHLFKLATFWGVRYFYPIPVTGDDKRSVQLIEKGREKYVQGVIRDQIRSFK